MKVSDLRLREVINVYNGKKLGLIRDIEFDLDQGKIKSIILPGGNKVLGLLGKNDDIVIPWHKIKKMGLDVILVELNDFNDTRYEEY
ncbi:YlmC/YmxH family sporulation protein [Thermincola ferriacetica]|uniref:YlmC/YmxH family sporulation protein n=1 Tax=Thermincola ferriacetica TaxID=281456 RepID=A0A0L6W4S3_9FIRM|nr:YlmC/YmxH family sporulation protein [Thermincola ferriacetica]